MVVAGPQEELNPADLAFAPAAATEALIEAEVERSPSDVADYDYRRPDRW